MKYYFMAMAALIINATIVFAQENNTLTNDHEALTKAADQATNSLAFLQNFNCNQITPS